MNRSVQTIVTRIRTLAPDLRSLIDPTQGTRFKRNIVKIARAHVLAQVLALLAAPALTRLYTPSDFGTLAVFTAVMTLLAAVSTMRAEWSVPSAATGSQAAALLTLGGSVLIATLVLGSVLGGSMLRALSPYWQGADLLDPYLWLLLIAILATAGASLLQAWHVRVADLTFASRTKLIQSLIAISASLMLGLGGFGPGGLIAGATLGALVAAALLFRTAPGLVQALAHLTWIRLAATRRRYGREVIQSTLVTALNAASLAAVPLLLAQAYSSREVGWYALMSRLAVAPVGLVTAALAQSFWAEAADRIRRSPGELKRLYIRTSAKLFGLALLISPVFLAAPLYVGPIFGEEEWQGAGWVLFFLTPMLVGQIVVAAMSHLTVHHRQQWQLIWDGVRLAISAALLVALPTLQTSLYGTVAAVSVFYGLMYLVLFLLNLNAYRSRIPN